jgi:glycosyltransferase involved in cell wall biosynthesis
MHLPLFRPTRGKTILTIHDIRDLYPQHATMNQTFYKTVLRRALQRADHVVTVSETIRSEILDFYPHTPVSVVYNGFDVGAFAGVTQADCATFLAKYKLPREFVFAVGHFERRKNYPRLIDAMKLLKQRGLDCPLVIVGNDSGEGAALGRQIEALGLTGQVTLLTGLSDLEVRCAYMLCSLFVFPSAYEGFGIPILEAMAAKRPMVLSNLPVFREITEDQAIYFPPDDVDAIADAIAIGLTASDARERMVQYGLRRLPDFSFDRLADGMVNVYEGLV